MVTDGQRKFKGSYGRACVHGLHSSSIQNRLWNCEDLYLVFHECLFDFQMVSSILFVLKNEHLFYLSNNKIKTFPLKVKWNLLLYSNAMSYFYFFSSTDHHKKRQVHAIVQHTRKAIQRCCCPSLSKDCLLFKSLSTQMVVRGCNFVPSGP